MYMRGGGLLMYSVLCEPHTVYGLSCECMVNAVCCMGGV